MSTQEFNRDTFSFLGHEGLEAGWANIGESELEATISELIAAEITVDDAPEIFGVVETYLSVLSKLKLAVIGEWVETEVLTIHADENGLLDVVLGPAIFSHEGALVLKVGNNQCQVVQEGAACSIGGLAGDIEVVEKEGKDDEGKETKYLAVSFDVYLADLDKGISIPFVLDPEKIVSKQAFKQKLKANDIAQFLKPVPQGGSWISMNDLAVGEYLLTELIENPVSEYGRSWTMTLAGIGDVRSKGRRFQKQLEASATMYAKMLAKGLPITLLISSKNEMSQGIQINAGFFKRAPKPEMMPAKLKATATGELKSAQPNAQLPPAATGEVVETITVAATVAAQTSLGIDDIDF